MKYTKYPNVGQRLRTAFRNHYIYHNNSMMLRYVAYFGKE